MAYFDDEFLPENRCEICGAELANEIVIQEFADGSIARLCSECAAGAALQPDTGEFRFPDDIAPRVPGADDSSLDDSSDVTSAFETGSLGNEVVAPAPAPAPAAAPAASQAAADLDPLEKTRELLTPVVDLITLQREMQGALQRLATSLQTFADGVVSENIEKSATVESRLETLERELEVTRARLRETEALLAHAAAAPAAPPAPEPATEPAEPAEPAAEAAAPAAAPPEPTAESAAEPIPVPEPPAAEEPEASVAQPPAEAEPAAAQPAAAEPAPSVAAASFWDFDATMEATGEATEDEGGGDTGEFTAREAAEAVAPAAPVSDSSTQLYSMEDLDSTMPPAAPKLVPPPVAPPAGPPTAEHHSRPGFQLPEVQIAQKYFNESQFTDRVRDVRKSLGKPKANLTKLIGAEPRALVTVFWDIIWYQYLVDLRREIPTDQRVVLHREGMDLDELQAVFKDKNASVDDEGRLDASELEVRLLSDPSTLITEMSVDEERALEDATEEIWDQKTAPEFKWDD